MLLLFSFSFYRRRKGKESLSSLLLLLLLLRSFLLPLLLRLLSSRLKNLTVIEQRRLGASDLFADENLPLFQRQPSVIVVVVVGKRKQERLKGALVVVGAGPAVREVAPEDGAADLVVVMVMGREVGSVRDEERGERETKKPEKLLEKKKKDSLCRLGDDQARAFEVALFVERESGPAVHGCRVGDRERATCQESAGEDGVGEAGREGVWFEEDGLFFFLFLCCCCCSCCSFLSAAEDRVPEGGPGGRREAALAVERRRRSGFLSKSRSRKKKRRRVDRRPR